MEMISAPLALLAGFLAGAAITFGFLWDRATRAWQAAEDLGLVVRDLSEQNIHLLLVLHHERPSDRAADYGDDLDDSEAWKSA